MFDGEYGSFVQQASQNSFYRRAESVIQYAIPSTQKRLQNGDLYEKESFHHRLAYGNGSICLCGLPEK